MYLATCSDHGFFEADEESDRVKENALSDSNFSTCRGTHVIELIVYLVRQRRLMASFGFTSTGRCITHPTLKALGARAIDANLNELCEQ